ncbi:signal peptidase I [Cerasicoccus maritimus]|uniref:signal peptidase I n=1 Tax=Cerasicoccus maritimus TaxID=490089 RepID=UPI002852D7AA|nr:signal peptidase I [Cerasicoccus maritimus]
MGLFGNKQKKLRKECRMLLSYAHKVVNYRRDELSEEALAQIAQARGMLEEKLVEKAPEKELTRERDTLDKVLKRHGGAIYPVTFGNENVEMVIIAVILAIGVRTYFFQPFKIPTNSMWPTYAGLNATVYPPDEPRPSFPKRFFLGATQGLLGSAFGNFNHYITAPVSGELVLPVYVQQTDAGLDGLRVMPFYLPEQRPFAGGKIPLLNKIQTSQRVYRIVVGGEIVSFDTPGEFELEDVILQSWFPEESWLDYGLTKVFMDYQAKGKVSQYAGQRGAYLIHTGIQIGEGNAILDFNINSGDMLFVDRFSYNFVEPKVGSPIVFRTENIPGARRRDPQTGILHPEELYYIKRLVGAPGDTLEIKGNTLYSNGAPVEGADAFDLNSKREEGYPGYRAIRWLGEGNTLTIPEDYFFAMGDNSPHSSDGRFWGYGEESSVLTPAEKAAGVPVNMVPEDDVIGRASFIFYPFSHRWGPAK